MKTNPARPSRPIPRTLLSLPTVLALGALLAVAPLVGCEGGDGADPCPGGEASTAGVQRVCVYGAQASGIIENGFDCPPELPFQQAAFDWDGAPIVVCAEGEDVDLDGLRDHRRAEEQGAGDGDQAPADAPPDAPAERDDPRGEAPPDGPPAEALPHPQAGDRCSVLAESCEVGFDACLVCADGLQCVPVADDPGFGRCAPVGDGVAGQACAADDLAGCGESLACLDPGDGAPFCSNVCTYTNWDCAFGFGCPNRGGVCAPVDPAPEFPAGGCRPGADACAAGEGCYAQVTRHTYEGFECAPAGGGGPFSACRAPSDCQPGLACAIHTGWENVQAPQNALFDLVWTGDEPHPLAGRSASQCMPLCGPGLPVCAEDQICARLQAPAGFEERPPLADSFFAFVGVCSPVR